MLHYIFVLLLVLAGAVPVIRLRRGRSREQAAEWLATRGRWEGVATVGLPFGLWLAAVMAVAMPLSDPGLDASLGFDLVMTVLGLGAGMAFGAMMRGFLVATVEAGRQFDEVLDKARAGSESAPVAPAAPTPAASADVAAARALLDERDRALRKGRFVGMAAATVLLIVSILMAIALEARPWFMGLLAAAYFNYRLFSSWHQVRPRSVLLLRKFSSPSDSRAHLGGLLGEVCRGLAIPLTVQDSSFEGELPIGLQAAKRYVALPLAFLTPLLLFRITPEAAFGDSTVFLVSLAYVGAIPATYYALKWGLERRGVVRVRPGGSRAALTALHGRIEARRLLYSGTRVMKLPDREWREGIGSALSRVDCAVVDVSRMSPNLAWELETAYARLPPRAILLTWDLRKTDTAADEGEGLPAHIRRDLRKALGDERWAASPQAPYASAEDVGIRAFLNVTWPMVIARCLTARSLARSSSPPPGPSGPGARTERDQRSP